MEFLGEAKLEDFIDKEIHVIVMPRDETIKVCQTLPFCRTLMIDGQLHVDLVPKLSPSYIREIPDSAQFIINEQELAVGRYAMLVSDETEIGQIVEKVAKKRKEGE